MYGGLPARSRRAVKATLAAAWLFAAAAGVAAVALSPVAIIDEIGFGGTLFSGALLAGTALIAVSGVIRGWYAWEWVASWGASTALAPYLITIWALVFTTDPWRATQAFLVTSLLTFFISRSAHCSAHAAKLRSAHIASAGATGTVGGDHARGGD
jgi:hypothetical protein